MLVDAAAAVRVGSSGDDVAAAAPVAMSVSAEALRMAVTVTGGRMSALVVSVAVALAPTLVGVLTGSDMNHHDNLQPLLDILVHSTC